MQALSSAPAGDVEYAGPDSPEVYFLTGSPDRPVVLYDFLEALDGSPLDTREYLDSCNLIVLNHDPKFSRAIRPETLGRVAEQLPHAATAGHFEIRWRE
jgi:hypothetical protein